MRSLLKDFLLRASKYALKRGKVRRYTLKLNELSEKLLLMGPDDINAQLIKKLEKGKPLDEILVAHVRSTYPKGNRVAARGALQRIYETESTRTLGALAFGTFLALDGLSESALGFFREAGVDLAKRVATFEYFDVYVKEEPKKALAEVDSLLNGTTLNPSDYAQLIRVAIKNQHTKDVRKWVANLDTPSNRKKLSELEVIELDWWVKMLADDGKQVKALKNTVNFAVMDYNMLDYWRSSSNRGDYVQTLAAISHLLRFQNVEYVGGSDLAGYLTKLKSHVQKHRRIEGKAPVKVQPVELHRDYSSGREYPENTWLISNGWFMHRPYKGEVDFPYPKNVNPIMISFHIQDADVLNAKVAAELKKFGPIGCRDWTTVYRLRDWGVPAFFSGCVTTTVGQVLPKARFGGKIPKLAVVEAGRKWMKFRYMFMWKWFYIQIGDYVRRFSLVEGIEDARGMLAKYADYGKVITKRLHCYLPARSMGLPVEFVPGKRSDVRFEGLLDLNEADFNKIRHGIEHKLEVIVGHILEGKSYEEVMKIWRELVQPDVEFAEQYATNLEPLGESAIDLPEVYKKFNSHVVKLNDNKRGKKAVDVAFACDQNLQNELIVVIASMMKNTKREVNAHILTRGLSDDYFAKVASLFPTVNFYFHDFSDISYGSKVNLMKHITVSTFDRLFLPQVLTELDKVLYLDVDILVRGDVGELYDTALGDYAFAGKKSRLDGWSSLIDVITRISLQLPAKQAWALRRRAHATGDLTADTYNAGILVMNLKKMRAENFVESNLYLVEELRLNDQDVMNFWSRGRAVALNDDWNYVPTQDYSKNPQIVHWAGPGKPWKQGFALYKDEFQSYAKELGLKIGK
ncbi:glycosyltransferase family 8 protein [Rhodoluna limnophila]|uniref:glycosyltransferase family 8 protein n=1 Tax=Rhodoluna limnophila TaxID=232537 RepID=UPI001106F05D|nr:glycosyltransferase family 8 protein [Rhodoluna limnophila]